MVFGLRDTLGARIGLHKLCQWRTCRLRCGRQGRCGGRRVCFGFLPDLDDLGFECRQHRLALHSLGIRKPRFRRHFCSFPGPRIRRRGLRSLLRLRSSAWLGLGLGPRSDFRACFSIFLPSRVGRLFLGCLLGCIWVCLGHFRRNWRCLDLWIAGGSGPGSEQLVTSEGIGIRRRPLLRWNIGSIHGELPCDRISYYMQSVEWLSLTISGRA